MISKIVSIALAGFAAINPVALKPPAPPSPVTSNPSTPSSVKTFTYSIQTRGVVSADIEEFRTQVSQTLASPLGWSRAGLRFEEVASGGRLTIILAAPAEVAAANPVCSATLSCSVGSLVYINDDRWRLATDPWNAAGGSLRDYRHMVINHEVGHSLGHGHADCPAAGTPAPVMRQQSTNLQGCTFNPWPLASELWYK